METERCGNPPLAPTNGAAAESHVGGEGGKGANDVLRERERERSSIVIVF